MLKQRILTAVALLIPLSLILWSGGMALTCLALAVYLIINMEYYRFATTLPTKWIVAFALSSVLIPLSYLGIGWQAFGLTLIVVAMFHLALLVVYVELQSHEPEYRRIVPAALLGLAYTGVLGSVLVIITEMASANRIIVWLLFVVIFSDTFAYFGGRLIGGPKLARRISSKKTWAGAVCGLLGAIGGSLLATFIMERDSDLLLVVCFGAGAGIIAQFGDLVESLIKRVYQVKDSSRLLPGHGGLLDRVDALMFTAPVLFFAEFLR